MRSPDFSTIIYSLREEPDMDFLAFIVAEDKEKARGNASTFPRASLGEEVRMPDATPRAGDARRKPRPAPQMRTLYIEPWDSTFPGRIVGRFLALTRGPDVSGAGEGTAAPGIGTE